MAGTRQAKVKNCWLCVSVKKQGLWAHLIQLLKLSHESLGPHDALRRGCTAVRHVFLWINGACLPVKARLSLALQLKSCPSAGGAGHPFCPRVSIRRLGAHNLLLHKVFTCKTDHADVCLHIAEHPLRLTKHSIPWGAHRIPVLCLCQNPSGGTCW